MTGSWGFHVVMFTFACMGGGFCVSRKSGAGEVGGCHVHPEGASGGCVWAQLYNGPGWHYVDRGEIESV